MCRVCVCFGVRLVCFANVIDSSALVVINDRLTCSNFAEHTENAAKMLILVLVAAVAARRRHCRLLLVLFLHAVAAATVAVNATRCC